ncbi:hypothetical protein [Hyphomonas sp.]|uniref:hypothetical protein n=1 Tax=Hyphomonas sp. TaxID=87 RepID=UPI003566B50F
MDRAITARGRADKVFWFPAWQAIYASDAERTLDFTHAEPFGALTRRAYERLSVTLIDMPLTDAATRAALIRDTIGVYISSVPPGLRRRRISHITPRRSDNASFRRPKLV